VVGLISILIHPTCLGVCCAGTRDENGNNDFIKGGDESEEAPGYDAGLIRGRVILMKA